MDSPRRGSPRRKAEGSQYRLTATSRIIGTSEPSVNGYSSTRGDSEPVRRDYERLEGLAMFAVTIGAALFLIVHVLAHSWGWQGAALAMTASECLTLVLVAVASDRGVRR